MAKKRVEKEITKKCNYCGLDISPDEKFTLLGTYEGDDIQEDFFHFKCFVTWYHQKVQEKARNIVQTAQKGAVDVFHNLQNMLGGSGGKGMEQIGNMLNLDLTREKAQDLIPLDEKKEKKCKKKKK